MIYQIPDLLTPAQVAHARAALESTAWVDGLATAGHQGALVKRNRQLPVDHPVGRALGDMILGAITANPVYFAASLPHRILPPMFNRYEGGEHFGNHVDGAIRTVPGAATRIRTDISCTVFLTDPEEYDGGELVVEDTYGPRAVKLPAGHAILYPGHSVHRVEPVTRGARISSFFWIQSMIRDDAKRALLFDLDRGIQQGGWEDRAHPSAVKLTGVYHNLLRHWAEI